MIINAFRSCLCQLYENVKITREYAIRLLEMLLHMGVHLIQGVTVLGT